MADNAGRASRNGQLGPTHLHGPGSFTNGRPMVAAGAIGLTAGREERADSLGLVRGRLGWLPLLSLAISLGLLLEAASFTLARMDIPNAAPVFWLGQFVMVTPIAARLMVRRVARRERLGLVLFLGLGLYLLKILNSPASFTYYDELQHWATLDSIVRTGHLFIENRLLITSSVYPGLEVATSAVVQISGLSYFAAGALVIGLLRLILVMALFIFVERLTRSSRLAGLALFVYVCNPSFVFFDAQFAYETMALSFAALALMAITVRDETSAGERASWTVVALLALGTTVVSHHITSFALAGALVAWYALTVMKRRRLLPAEGPGWLAPVAVVLTVAWLVEVASITIRYLKGPAQSAIDGLVSLLTQEQQGRGLFQSSTGTVAPIDERLTGIIGALLLVAAIPFGLFYLWRRRPASPMTWLLALVACAYPGTLVLRISSGGWQAAERSSAFIFVGLGIVVAYFLGSRTLRRARLLQLSLAAVALAVVFRSGVIGGWPPFARLPGSYLVEADSRSIDLRSITAAEWAQGVLGPGNRIAADRDNNILFGSYGEQAVVWYQTDSIDVSPIFFSGSIGREQIALIKAGHVRYLVVDTRLASALPQLGEYYDDAELADGPHTEPIPLQDLDKFDAAPGVSRVFDDGSIRVFDVSGLANGN